MDNDSTTNNSSFIITYYKLYKNNAFKLQGFSSKNYIQWVGLKPLLLPPPLPSQLNYAGPPLPSQLNYAEAPPPIKIGPN